MWQAHALLSLPPHLGGCAGSLQPLANAHLAFFASRISLPSLSMQRGARPSTRGTPCYCPSRLPLPTARAAKAWPLSQACWGVLVWRAHTAWHTLRSVWWMLPWAITGGPVVSLHVILQLRDSPQGKVIVYQEVLTPTALSCQYVSAAHELYCGTSFW